MPVEILGSRSQISKFATEQRIVKSGVTVTDGDFVDVASDAVDSTSVSTLKLAGVVTGGEVTNLVSRNYRAPVVLGDGTKQVLITLVEGLKLRIPVNGSLPADAAGSYFKLVVKSQAVLTSDATAPANNDTITVGGVTYTFKTTLTGAANEVLINTTATAALTNLKAAINLTGTIGTDYGTGTVINPLVTATTKTSTTLVIEAITQTTDGTTLAVSATSAHLSFDTPTLTGGTGRQTVDVLSKSATVGQLLCLRRVATNAAGTVFGKGTFVVAAPQSITTLS